MIDYYIYIVIINIVIPSSLLLLLLFIIDISRVRVKTFKYRKEAWDLLKVVTS